MRSWLLKLSAVLLGLVAFLWKLLGRERALREAVERQQEAERAARKVQDEAREASETERRKTDEEVAEIRDDVRRGDRRRGLDDRL